MAALSLILYPRDHNERTFDQGAATAGVHNQADHAAATRGLSSAAPRDTSSSSVASPRSHQNANSAAPRKPQLKKPHLIPGGVPKLAKNSIRLHIPKLHLNATVLKDVTLDMLARGPGHFPETVMPGEDGNCAIAAHHNTNGRWFQDLDTMKPGDTIMVDASGKRFVYRVVRTHVIKPTNVAILDSHGHRPELTLITCTHPATHRFVVQALLDRNETMDLKPGAPGPQVLATDRSSIAHALTTTAGSPYTAAAGPPRESTSQHGAPAGKPGSANRAPAGVAASQRGRRHPTAPPGQPSLSGNGSPSPTGSITSPLAAVSQPSTLGDRAGAEGAPGNPAGARPAGARPAGFVAQSHPQAEGPPVPGGAGTVRLRGHPL